MDNSGDISAWTSAGILQGGTKGATEGPWINVLATITNYFKKTTKLLLKKIGNKIIVIDYTQSCRNYSKKVTELQIK